MSRIAAMFSATHVDGPMDGEELPIAAPRVPGILYYAPAPVSAAAVTANGYMMVGYDEPPEAPWPGQVSYELDRERSELRPHSMYEGMEEGTAVYVLAGA